DLALVDCVQADIRRLEQLRLTATMDRVDADLALGAGSGLVPELELLIGSEPLDERLRRQLMLALYRSGRHTEALDIYRQLSELLRDRLGLDPGPELQELQRRILVHDPTLAPPHADAVPALGPAPNDDGAVAADSQRDRQLSGDAPSRLPARGPRVFGRERELDELHVLLTDPGVALVTLTGAGGSGKTTLGLETARRAESSFSDGASVVWLAGISDVSQVVSQIAGALGVEVSSQEPAAETLARVLRFQQRLIVIDNFEHVITAAPVVAQLARDCARVKLLVTSRAPLHVGMERIYRVDGLAALESLKDVTPRSLRHWPASALFIERARAANPKREFESSELVAVAQLCSYLGGLPLALELAAASMALLSPGEILERLRSSSRPFGPAPRDSPERQQTIRATIDWSLNLLAENEQRLFGRLGAFAGGFTIDAAEAVCPEGDESVIDGLAILLDHGLIYRRASGPESRLALLEPIRDYARERLGADPGREHAFRRYAEHYATLAERAGAELVRGDPIRCLERLDKDLPNIRAVLQRTARQPDIDTALRMVSAMDDYFFMRGLVAEQRPWLSWALDQPPGDPVVRARALFALGWLSDEDGEYTQAATALEECRALCELTENSSLAAQCEAHRACNEWYLGHFEQSTRFADRALAMATRGTDPYTEALVLLVTGYCAQTYEDARAKSRGALTLLESLGDRTWPPRIKANLAKLARRAGDRDYARLLIGESIAGATPIWGAGLRAQNERELGLVELSEHRYAKARSHLSRSLGLCLSIGDRRDTRDVLIGLAAIQVTVGAKERARVLLAAARALLDVPLDIKESLQGCGLPAERLDKLATVAAHATLLPPLAAAQLDAILNQASAWRARDDTPTGLMP
ncbi:MAG TPA: BTAD domain-containing putative transcriptional regulator, partial [Solirubrobacteraceae bacterium]